MLVRWERIYRIFFYGLLAAVAVLVVWELIPVLWDALVHGGWRPRATFALLIGWYITMRLAARTTRFRAFMSDWPTRSLLHVICFNLLFIVFPLGVALYVAPLRNPDEMLVSIGLMSVLASVVGWKARPTRSR